MTDLTNTRVAYAQEWTEYERGWGQRPDGWSLHSSREAAVAFKEAYVAKYNNRAVVPDEYSAPQGDPFAVSVDEGVTLDFGDKGGMWVTSRRLPDGIARL